MMKVLLVGNVRGLGKVGDQVIVRRGRARGELFPNKLAVPLNKENVENCDRLRVEASKRNQDAVAKAGHMRDSMNGAIIEFSENANIEDGILFGSVTARQIAAKLSERFATNISHGSVRLPLPIKQLGLHEVEVELHGDVSALVTISVLRNEQHN